MTVQHVKHACLKLKRGKAVGLPGIAVDALTMVVIDYWYISTFCLTCLLDLFTSLPL